MTHRTAPRSATASPSALPARGPGRLSAHRPPAMPSHVPQGAELLALELAEIARGVRGLDVLRRSVDRAPPGRS